MWESHHLHEVSWVLGLPWTSRARDRLRGSHPRAHNSGRDSVCSAGPQSPVTSHVAAKKMPKGTILLEKSQTTWADCERKQNSKCKEGH